MLYDNNAKGRASLALFFSDKGLEDQMAHIKLSNA